MEAAAPSWFGTSLRFAGVFAAAALALRALDGVPALLLGPEERSLGSIAELERADRAQLLLPTYFPDTVRWPPSSVRASSRPAAVALTFDAAAGGPRLVLVQALQRGSSVDHLLPGGVVLESAAADGGPEGATLSRVKAEDGTVWRELSWKHEGRWVRLRSLGPIDELFRMARSVRREGRG